MGGDALLAMRSGCPYSCVVQPLRKHYSELHSMTNPAKPTPGPWRVQNGPNGITVQSQAIEAARKEFGNG